MAGEAFDRSALSQAEADRKAALEDKKRAESERACAEEKLLASEDYALLLLRASKGATIIMITIATPAIVARVDPRCSC